MRAGATNAAGGLGSARYAVTVTLRATRILAGVVLLFHGLAHALPGMLATRDGLVGGLGTTGWTLAMAGFLAAGFGALGLRPFRDAWRGLAVVGLVGSLIVVALQPDGRLITTGLLIDAGLLAVLFFLRPEVAGARARPAGRGWHAVARVVFEGLAILIVAWVALVVATRPWHHAWGTTAAERALALPTGGMTLDAGGFAIDHAITIRAPVAEVWPWLAQIGQDRGGFYSHAALENLFGLEIRNADRIHPEWQDLAAGDFVRAAPRGWLAGRAGDRVGWKVLEVEPERHLVLEYWGAFVLREDGAGGTRLHVRSWLGRPPVWAAPLMLLAFEPVHFIMERAMLIGIRNRAERARPRHGQSLTEEKEYGGPHIRGAGSHGGAAGRRPDGGASRQRREGHREGP